MTQHIKIAFADDDALFREGVKFVLNREANFSIVLEAENGKILVEYLRASNELPDIVITDLRMPELNGVEVTKIIREEFPTIKVIALSSYATKEFINQMILVGASSYLLKNTKPKDIVTTIQKVYDLGFYYDATVLEIVNKVDDTTATKIKADLTNNVLTKRELEILELLCQQYTTKEIADKIFLSPRTVEGHRNNLLLKTGAKNIAGLVIYGIQKKIVAVDLDLDWDSKFF